MIQYDDSVNEEMEQFGRKLEEYKEYETRQKLKFLNEFESSLEMVAASDMTPSILEIILWVFIIFLMIVTMFAL